MAVIDLDEYRSHKTHVFSGRMRGEAVRHEVDLARLEEEHENITIRVPEDVFSVTSSFFLGMLGDSIRALGEDGFKEKYSFEGPIVDTIIEDGIVEALREDAALGES